MTNKGWPPDEAFSMGDENWALQEWLHEMRAKLAWGQGSVELKRTSKNASSAYLRIWDHSTRTLHSIYLGKPGEPAEHKLAQHRSTRRGA